MYKSQLQHQTEELKKELKDRMLSLEAQRHYKDLTLANFEAYRTQYEKILAIEKIIEINNKIINKLKNELLDYDDHLGTGMDTSQSLTNYNIKEE